MGSGPVAPQQIGRWGWWDAGGGPGWWHASPPPEGPPSGWKKLQVW